MSFVFNIFNTSLGLFLLNDYFQRNYPENYKEVFYTFGYNCIYLFSKCQIYCNFLSKNIKKKIDEKPRLKFYLNSIYKYFQHYASKNENVNKEIEEIKMQDIYNIFNEINSKNIYSLVNEESFFIYSDIRNIDNKNKIINKMITPTYPLDLQYEVSSVKFILIELIINKTPYKMSLKDDSYNDSYNYYIVDNILDHKFFIYYINHHLLDVFTWNNKDMLINSLKLKIVDQNAVIINVDLNKQSLQIKKDTYSIIDVE